jgi:hypothetical protein
MPDKTGGAGSGSFKNEKITPINAPVASAAKISTMLFSFN